MKTTSLLALSFASALLGCGDDRPASSVGAAVPTAASTVQSAAVKRDAPARAVDPSADGATAVEGSVVPRDDPRYEKIPAADDAAWADAPRLTMAHSPKACEARVLGKFVRIRCEGYYSSYSESLSGNAETVRYAHQDAKWSSDYKKKVRESSRAAVFPLAPGERRVIQFADLFGGWRTPWTASTEAVVSAYWLEDEAAPTVVID